MVNCALVRWVVPLEVSSHVHLPAGADIKVVSVKSATSLKHAAPNRKFKSRLMDECRGGEFGVESSGSEAGPEHQQRPEGFCHQNHSRWPGQQ